MPQWIYVLLYARQSLTGPSIFQQLVSILGATGWSVRTDLLGVQTKQLSPAGASVQISKHCLLGCEYHSTD